MRPRVVLFASLIILLTSLAAEGAESWKRYTVTGHQFSVALPTLPAMAYDPGSYASLPDFPGDSPSGQSTPRRR